MSLGHNAVQDIRTHSAIGHTHSAVWDISIAQASRSSLLCTERCEMSDHCLVKTSRVDAVTCKYSNRSVITLKCSQRPPKILHLAVCLRVAWGVTQQWTPTLLCPTLPYSTLPYTALVHPTPLYHKICTSPHHRICWLLVGWLVG